MTYDEALAITGSTANTDGIRKIGCHYWLTVSENSGFLYYVPASAGSIAGDQANLDGVRPVVIMKDGVYIVSGDGTAASPYVLGKE